MATQTTAGISESEYLRSTYRPDCDYVEGTVLERSVGEYDHSFLQTLIVMALAGRQSAGSLRVLTEQRVQVGPRRYRISDICLMPMPHTRTPVIAEPPLAAIEILSPDDTVQTMFGRLQDFVAMGVPHVWLADPQSHTLYSATAGGVAVVTDRKARLSDDDILLDFEELFRQLAE